MSRLVYSTEHGRIGKSAVEGKPKKAASNSSPAIKHPSKHGTRIRREMKGRGGKTVCVIEGLPMNDIEQKALLKKLKGELGTGGALKNGWLEIQGDHRQRLLQLLEKQGIKAKPAGG